MSPGEHFVVVNASVMSFIVTGSGGISSAFYFCLYLFPNFYCWPTSVYSNLIKSLLKGFIAAYLHTNFISDPEYPLSFLAIWAYSKFSAL